VARRPAIALAAALAFALAAALLAVSSGSTHRLRAVFAAAVQVRSGEQVRVAGRTVGSVRSVALRDGRAVLTLGIDGSQWPLHAGTTAMLRFGAAAAYASRYVQLQPGPAGAPALAEDALLPESDTATPVEFDQFYATFGPRTRRHLGAAIAGAAATLHGHATDLRRAVELGGPGTERTAGMLSDLGLDPQALSTLVSSGASTAAGLRGSDAQLQGVVDHAAETIGVFADNAAALQQTLANLPSTLSSARGMLAHLDRSLGGLGRLVTDIAPGAAGLVTTAPLVTRTLRTLRRIGPAAQTALATGAIQLPRLAGFLGAARPFAPSLATALARVAPMVACLRPYAPEIGGWLDTWQGGAVDSVGHYGRVDVIQTPVLPGTTLDSAQAVALANGSVSYAFPRPPGLNAGQPWFQPQCGAGPSSLDPAADPEAHR
jgi:phospholipid/cholesterol/gamma-HCH transport system substrate-binding protein